MNNIAKRNHAEEELFLLQKINNMLNAGEGHDVVFKTIVDSLRGLYSYDSVAIHLLNNNQKHMTVKSYSADQGVAGKLEKLTGQTIEGYKAPLYEGSLLKKVVDTRKPVITDDIAWVLTSYTDRKSLQSMAKAAAKLTKAQWGIGVPLMAGDKIVGIIGCGSKEKLTEEDAQKLASFGAQAGLAIEKQQRYETLEEKVKERTTELKLANEELQKKIAERKQAEEALQKRTYDLGERVKDLNCLYGIADLVEKPGISLEEIFQGTVDLIPPSWPYPEITCARIIFDDQVYKTKNFKKTEWKQSSDINVFGDKVGSIEVYYLEEKPKIGESPFLKEDRNLINAVSERLGRITERTHAGEEIQRSNEFLNSIIDCSADAIVTTNAEGIATTWSRGAEDLYGYSAEEILGKSVDMLYPKELREERKRWQKSITEGKTLRNITAKIYNSSGDLVDISLSLAPLKDESGKIIGTVGVSKDITERKLAEEALLWEKQRLDNVTGYVNCGLLLLDNQAKVTYANRVAEEWFGALDQIGGEFCWELFNLKDPEKECAALEVLRTGKTVHSDTFMESIHGEDKFFYVVATPVKNKTGKICQITEVVVDITERKHAEQEHKYLLNELAEKNKELEQIVYVASHDLRSPLVNIQGFSKELDEAYKQVRSVLDSEDLSSAAEQKLAPYLKEDIPEALQYITSSTSKMNSLISGLLRLSRLRRTTLTVKQLDMNKLMSNVIRDFEYQIKEKGATVQIDELPPCNGDETQINQVFSNLLDNALKYLDPNREGIIRISGGKEKGYAIYCVEDNGVGIADEYRNKIFEIFHRLNPVAGIGEGLGLTMARKILYQHNGKIWVESEHGQGSKLYVSIPTASRIRQKRKVKR